MSDVYLDNKMKRGFPHLHTLTFDVDSDNNMNEITGNKRTSTGAVTIIQKKKVEYEIGITRSEWNKNVRMALNIVVYFSHDRGEGKVILSACARAIAHIDDKYIEDIISDLNENFFFQPLKIGERMYRCLILGIHGIPVHIFKTYSARTIQYPSIKSVQFG